MNSFFKVILLLKIGIEKYTRKLCNLNYLILIVVLLHIVKYWGIFVGHI